MRRALREEVHGFNETFRESRATGSGRRTVVRVQRQVITGSTDASVAEDASVSGVSLPFLWMVSIMLI